MLETFLTFLKIGLFTIGGGIAMIPLLKEQVVNKKKWFTDEEIINIISICQSVPGVVAVNLATYVGFKKHGFLGSLIATIAVVIPSFIIIIIIAFFFPYLSNNIHFEGAMAALRAASFGLIIVTIYNMGIGILNGIFPVIIFIISIFIIKIIKISIAKTIIIFFILGLIYSIFANKNLKKRT